MNEEIKNIIENIEKRINLYWNFYFIVVITTIGWLMSSKIPFTLNQGIILTIAIILFFVANLFVIKTATRRIIAFENELNLVSEAQEFKSNTLKKELSRNSMKWRIGGVFILHGIIDISIIFAILSKLN